MRQRKAIKDTELEGLVVNGLTGVEGLAKADKWDGRSLLATPIHRLAGTGAIASSMWCLMVGPSLHQQPFQSSRVLTSLINISDVRG